MEPDETPEQCLDIYRDTERLKPRDFSVLRANVVLCIGVAMLWGWLPAFKDCHLCEGPMKLCLNQREGDKYTDPVTWRCRQEVALRQVAKKGPQHKKRCYGEVAPRRDMWLSGIKAPLADIMECILFWCDQSMNWKTMGKWSGLTQKQVWKMTKEYTHCSQFYASELVGSTMLEMLSYVKLLRCFVAK